MSDSVCSDFPKIINTVFDSLDVRVFRHAAPSERMVSDSQVWWAWSEDWEPGDPPAFVQLPGLGTFRVKPGGAVPYAHVLINPQICDIRIWNPAKWNTPACANTGQFYVSFRSVFMQRYGLFGVRAVLAALEALYCVPGSVAPGAPAPFDRIARVDLAVDTQEPRDMLWADLDRFVCRARKLDTWTHLTPAQIEKLFGLELDEGSYLPMEAPAGDSALAVTARAASQVLRGFFQSVANDLQTHGEADLSRVVSHNRRPQTVYFGRFGSKLYARRYNKYGSLVVQNKLHMLDVWLENGWSDGSPVWRTEFSISGDFLKDYSIIRDGLKIEDCRDLGLLEDVAPILWDYLVCDWLTMRDPVATDSNYRRWPISASWSVMAGAFGVAAGEGERDHSRTVPREDTHLTLQARGCSVSTVALRAAALGSVDDALQSMLDDFVYQLDDTFRADVDHRLLEFGLDPFSDTALSASLRRQRLREAAGS